VTLSALSAPPLAQSRLLLDCCLNQQLAGEQEANMRQHMHVHVCVKALQLQQTGVGMIMQCMCTRHVPSPDKTDTEWYCM
jgi:hypothetical protein